MTAERALKFSTSIENIRRRVTARIMRGAFRAGTVSGLRLPRIGIHRVLVCRSVHTLGDSLTLTPLLTELADVYPGAEVDIVSGCPSADALFASFPTYARCIAFRATWPATCWPPHAPCTRCAASTMTW